MRLCTLDASARQALVLTGLVLLMLLAMPHLAHASTADTSTGALPWETPLSNFRQSISGPVAFAISLIGIIICGATLIWGGEIGEFARRGIMLVLVVALIVLANNVLTSLFTSAELVAAAAAPVAWG